MKQVPEALLRKADRAVAPAEKLIPIDAESAISRAYYAMFYLAEALLAERDLEFKKHAAVHAAFGEHFTKTCSILSIIVGCLMRSISESLPITELTLN
jgi:uncharacterized protein (UPF0332 family)